MILPVIVRPARSSVNILSLRVSVLESEIFAVSVMAGSPASIAAFSSASVEQPVTVTAYATLSSVVSSQTLQADKSISDDKPSADLTADTFTVSVPVIFLL